MQDTSPSPVITRSLFKSVKQQSIEDILKSRGIELLCKYILNVDGNRSIPLVKVRNTDQQVFFVFIMNNASLYGTQGGCEINMTIGIRKESEEQRNYLDHLARDNVGVIHETKEGFLLSIYMGSTRGVFDYKCMGMTDNAYYPVLMFEQIQNSIPRGTLHHAITYLQKSSKQNILGRLRVYRDHVKRIMEEELETIDLVLQASEFIERSIPTMMMNKDRFDALIVEGNLHGENMKRYNDCVGYLAYLNDIQYFPSSYAHNIQEGMEHLAMREEKIRDIKQHILEMKIWKK